MKKVGFVDILVKVERKKRVVKMLETPTLLKRLFDLGEIDEEEFKEKTNTYNEAIREKETLLQSGNEENEKYSKLRLRSYQKKIVEYAKNFKSFAIFDEPRLGKTPTVIELLKEKELLEEKILIMCPGKVLGNWIKRIEEWGNKKAQKYEGGEIKSNILVCTHKRVRLSLDELLKWKPTVATLDEAHVLRNSKGGMQRLTEKQKAIKGKTGLIPINKSILKIGETAKHRYSLTGTPSVNAPEDIFAILQFIMPKAFNSFWSFCYYFFKVERNFMGGREIRGYVSKEKEIELQEILDYCSSNNKQKEAIPWLIPPKKTVVELELDEEQLALEHNLMHNGKIGEHFILNALEQITHYSSIVINPKILRQIEAKTHGVKTEYVLDYIMENNDKNIGIFSTRNEAIEYLKKLISFEFPSKKIYTITGKVSHSKSIKTQEEINKKSKKSDIILLGTIEACKEGISLEGLNKAIIIDQNYVASTMIQIFHRLDATTEEAQKFFGEKEIIILHVPETIDTIIENAILFKKKTTEVINNYKSFIKKRKGEKNG